VEVARTGYEVSYDEISGAYGGPMSLAPIISIKAYPELIWIRPDIGIGMMANTVAFGIGSVHHSVPWRGMGGSLKERYMLIPALEVCRKIPRHS
jgi:hypothetical protein